MNIPGYIIRRRLGAGGQAIVYLATQRSLDRPVALKVLHPRFAQSDEFTARFLNEGRILANLAHENVVTIHDIGVAGDLHFLSMELVEGGDLRQRIQAGLSVEAALDHLITIAECLSLAHERHIVHRDIKPGNVLFRRNGTLLLSDFGIAKQMQPGNELTLTGTGLGSPHYLSPEQAQGRPVDGRSDIYSLGAMAYEMFTGQRPYVSRSEIDTVFKHVNAPLPRLPEALVRLQPLVDRTMAKSPDHRVASAGELAGFLRTLRASSLEMACRLSPREAITGSLAGVPHVAPGDPGEATDMQVVWAGKPGSGDRSRLPLIRASLVAIPVAAAWLMWSSRTDVGHERAVSPPVAAVRAVEAGDVASVTVEIPDAARRVSQLVARAQTALDDLRLTRPRGNNALYYYRQVLAMDDGNAAAVEGQRRVAARYAGLATLAMERRDDDRARVLIGRGLRVDPSNIDLLTLQAKLRRSGRTTRIEAPSAPVRESGLIKVRSDPPGEIQGETPQELLNRIRGWFD